MTQHTRGRFHYPLPQVKDAQLLLRDATGTLLSTIPIDSAEWYGWLQDHTHQSFSYQTPTGAITLRLPQMEIFRAGEIHELSSRSEISSCFFLMSGTCYKGSPALGVLNLCPPHS